MINVNVFYTTLFEYTLMRYDNSKKFPLKNINTSVIVRTGNAWKTNWIFPVGNPTVKNWHFPSGSQLLVMVVPLI